MIASGRTLLLGSAGPRETCTSYVSACRLICMVHAATMDVLRRRLEPSEMYLTVKLRINCSRLAGVTLRNEDEQVSKWDLVMLRCSRMNRNVQVL